MGASSSSIKPHMTLIVAFSSNHQYPYDDYFPLIDESVDSSGRLVVTHTGNAVMIKDTGIKLFITKIGSHGISRSFFEKINAYAAERTYDKVGVFISAVCQRDNDAAYEYDDVAATAMYQHLHYFFSLVKTHIYVYYNIHLKFVTGQDAVSFDDRFHKTLFGRVEAASKIKVDRMSALTGASGLTSLTMSANRSDIMSGIEKVDRAYFSDDIRLMEMINKYTSHDIHPSESPFEQYIHRPPMFD